MSEVDEVAATEAEPEPENLEELYWRILGEHRAALEGLSLTMMQVLTRLATLEEKLDRPNSEG